MKILEHFEKHLIFYSILLIAALSRLIFFFDFHEILWDSGVYFGMAKYLWSAGSAGLWEHIRPVFWPLILGIAWQLKLNMVWFSRIIELLLVLVSTGFVYILGKKLFSQRAAIISSIIWAFSSAVFYLSFHAYTELPAITLVLAALTAFIYSRLFLAGFLTGLAFLTKFPAGIFIIVLAICLLSRKQWKNSLNLGIGFAVPAGIFLFSNYFAYNSFFGPLISAREAILSVLGCNVLRFQPWWQYFVWIFKDNFLNVFALAGLTVVFLKWKKQYLLPVLALVLPLLYFLQLHCRDYRYLILFLPFVALFAGHGLSWVFEKHLKKFWTVILLVILAISVFTGVQYYYSVEPSPNVEQYYKFLEDKQIDGEIWSSNPIISTYTDLPVNKIYYPVFNAKIAAEFNRHLTENPNIGAVFLDNCGGGIVCPDKECETELEKTRSFLNTNFKEAFFAQSGTCWYAVYTP